ncbi:MAG: class I SAM-dependent methyltransferase [Dehalococcoidia bacterium]
MSQQSQAQPGDQRIGYQENLEHWETVTPVHAASEFYDVEGFLAGKNKLHDFVVGVVGDVAGKSMLHLQCHFGLDTLSWARLGAKVTGLDFSPTAINEARRLAEQAGIDAEFAEADVLSPGDSFDNRFDIVFTSFGVLVWLHDLAPWAKTVARALKPGGEFFLFEMHPMLDSISEDRTISRHSPPMLKYGYFNDAGPYISPPDGAGGDYAEPDFVSPTTTYEWSHPLSDVFNALKGAGLRVTSFEEYPFCVYRAKDGMVRGDDGLWRMPQGVPSVPMLYHMKAEKPS